jgi:S1-C subfamily serine protease
MPNGPAKKSPRSEPRLKSLLKKCLPSKDTLINLTCIVLGIGALLTIIAKVPDLHNLYLREVVGARVYKVQAVVNGGGGTGFQVRAPSGVDYVMTNSHVCNAVIQMDTPENAGTVILVDDDGNVIRRRIVAVSDQTDLCLIEGAPGVSGLRVGSEPSKGETLTVVGHPHLRPLTLSSGEVIGTEDVNIIEFVISTSNPMLAEMIPTHPDAKCNMPKQNIEEIPLPEEIGGGSVLVCIDVTSNAYMTSIIIYPGNSGSPMVDYVGRVVGVAFAGDSTDNYGEVVSLTDINNFLAHY